MGLSCPSTQISLLLCGLPRPRFLRPVLERSPQILYFIFLDSHDFVCTPDPGSRSLALLGLDLGKPHGARVRREIQEYHRSSKSRRILLRESKLGAVNPTNNCWNPEIKLSA